MQNQIDDLRAQLDDLRKAVEMDRHNAIEIINTDRKFSIDEIKNIYTLLMPIVHRIFPDYAKTSEAINDITKTDYLGPRPNLKFPPWWTPPEEDDSKKT